MKLMRMKREAFFDAKAKSTMKSGRVKINDNAELIESAHLDDPIKN